MRKGLLLILLLCSALFFTACSSDEYEEEPVQVYRPTVPVPPAAVTMGVSIPGFVPDARAAVTVDFWHAMTGAQRAGLRAIIDAFHAYQPYVRVNEVALPNRARLEQDLARHERAGTLPHIATLTASEVTYYRLERVLLPLNLFMDDPHVGMSTEEIEGIFPVFHAGSVFGETWYSLPFAKHILVMYYDRGVFNDRNLTIPTTWVELERAARLVGLRFDAGLDAVWASIFAQRGGVYIDYTTGDAIFACGIGAAAMGTLTALAAIADGNNNAEPGIIIGSSARMPDGAEWFSAPIPGTDGNHAAEFAGDALVLFENVSHSIDSRVGAWEFLRFTLQTEIAADWAIASGTLPVTHGAMYLPRFRAHLIATPQARAGEASLQDGFWRTRHGYAGVVSDILLEEIEFILTGAVTAEVGLTRAELRANEALAVLR